MSGRPQGYGSGINDSINNDNGTKPRPFSYIYSLCNPVYHSWIQIYSNSSYRYFLPSPLQVPAQFQHFHSKRCALFIWRGRCLYEHSHQDRGAPVRALESHRSFQKCPVRTAALRWVQLSTCLNVFCLSSCFQLQNYCLMWMQIQTTAFDFSY